MSSALADLFEHNLWANQRLLDVCSGFGDEQLAATTPGTYGSVRDTLVHILASEGRYVLTLTGSQPQPALTEGDPFPGFAALREHAQRVGEALVNIAADFNPALVTRGTRQGQPFAVRASALVIQAINHATEHRTHVTTILSQQGLQPPALDAIGYIQETGTLTVPVAR